MRQNMPTCGHSRLEKCVLEHFQAIPKPFRVARNRIWDMGQSILRCPQKGSHTRVRFSGSPPPELRKNAHMSRSSLKLFFCKKSGLGTRSCPPTDHYEWKGRIFLFKSTKKRQKTRQKSAFGRGSLLWPILGSWKLLALGFPSPPTLIWKKRAALES